MTELSYHQFCPVAMASEILGARWTIVLLRELWAGSTRFNDLRRGVPRMSPALLSKRLRELEGRGIVERRLVRRNPDQFDYVLTPAGQDLGAVIMAIGIWGQRWVETAPTLENTDAGLLMWDMRRNLRTERLPARRATVQFIYSDQPDGRAEWWVLHLPDRVADLCSVDPGFDVDLYVRCDLRTMTAIWMGLDTVPRARSEDRLSLIGAEDVARGMQDWLGLSPFAAYPKHA
ncbi:winged helix-turn-helix transcriptional regulator [Pseudoponticoccus marisrubri]|uniref:HxlR family transcriptional regulator n=1 Tax=Pseudoponticoccus marisrubri TaxID=1685382 RepID=A0A0W7WDQ8_9RHOB|nr:helix-turn-helix domain-containing protein [Pseudoponticoccus marisrubri]KUF08769.1 HxlR family transcriptional regulator [Pseudoponticoccus marisrubri]